MTTTKKTKTESKTGTEEHQELMPLDDNLNDGAGGHLDADDSIDGQSVILKELSEDVNELAVTFGLDLSGHPEALIGGAASDKKSSVTLKVRAGIQLIAAKEKCQHGEFVKLCESIGFSRQAASEDMRYAEFASKIPANQRDKYLQLPIKAGLLLGSADPEVIEFMLDDENIDKASKVKTRTQLSELVDDLNTAHENNEKLNNETITLQEKVTALEDQLEMPVAGSDVHPWCALLRKEAPVLAEEANADLLSIETLSNNYLDMIDLAGDKATMYKNSAVIPAMAHVASIARNALSLFERMGEAHDVAPEDIAVFTVPMEAGELEEINTAISKMLSKRQARAIEREDGYRRSKAIKFAAGRPSKPA